VRGGSEPEVALDVTLSHLQRADAIRVIADGGTGRVVRSDLGPEDVGTTRRVADEPPGNGASTWTSATVRSPSAGQEETVRFYAAHGGETTLLRTYNVDWFPPTVSSSGRGSPVPLPPRRRPWRGPLLPRGRPRNHR
jgi:hypothetical protein